MLPLCHFGPPGLGSQRLHDEHNSHVVENSSNSPETFKMLTLVAFASSSKPSFYKHSPVWMCTIICHAQQNVSLHHEYVFRPDWSHQSLLAATAHTASFTQAIMHPSVQAIGIHYCHNPAADTALGLLSSIDPFGYCVDVTSSMPCPWVLFCWWRLATDGWCSMKVRTLQ